MPHFGDVADWNDAQALIKTALDTFGELHILVNNAGFLRDSTIFNMSEEDFDAVIRVHLKGHFCTHALRHRVLARQGQGERRADLRAPDQHQLGGLHLRLGRASPTTRRPRPASSP